MTLDAEPQVAQCPLCDYDLRGLAEPRCPECGFRFTWEELSDPKRRAHPFLFEHHRERNVWSLAQTLLGGWRPARFWRTLFPTQPSRPRRLILYWMIAAAVWLAVVTLQAARAVAALDQAQAAAQRTLVAQFRLQPAGLQRNILAQFGSAQAWAAASKPRFPHRGYVEEIWRSQLLQLALLAMLVWLMWPWVTFAALMIFQASMRRARVRGIHVWRCVIYGGDLSLWAALGMLALIAADVANNGLVGTFLGYAPVGPAVGGSVVLLALATYRLKMAYRHYLRFHQAAATAILSQIMFGLLAFKLLIDWSHWF